MMHINYLPTLHHFMYRTLACAEFGRVVLKPIPLMYQERTVIDITLCLFFAIYIGVIYGHNFYSSPGWKG